MYGNNKEDGISRCEAIITMETIYDKLEQSSGVKPCYEAIKDKLTSSKEILDSFGGERRIRKRIEMEYEKTHE